MTRRLSHPAKKLAVLERGALVVRHVGLGRIVDRLAHRFTSQLGHFEMEVDGFRFGGDRVGHLYYARELIDDEREAYFRSLFVAAVALGATVLEGGPYIGYLTLHAARAVGAAGIVVAVEPDPETVATLRANVARNGFEQRVRVIQGALSAEPGRATFFVTEGGDTSSLHQPPHHPARVLEVEVLRGDDLLDHADVIKLDVEGNEVSALRGLRSIIDRSRPVIFCECNPEMLETAKSSVTELRDELERLRYDARWIDEEARTLRSLDESWHDGYVNLACAPV